jgi:alpha/beta superfamily hydrolase
MAWSSVKKKHRDNFTLLYFTFTCYIALNLTDRKIRSEMKIEILLERMCDRFSGVKDEQEEDRRSSRTRKSKEQLEEQSRNFI